ncbi:kinase-like domain-containing protein [Mycena floridula]|nr:kinase-like domain-containing protein [Mycena floridula]
MDEDRSSNALEVVSTEPEYPIFHASSNQVVLWNSQSHALTVVPSTSAHRLQAACPYCKQTLPPGFEPDPSLAGMDQAFDDDPYEAARVSNYFQLLAIANETSSRASTPPPIARHEQPETTFPAEAMAEGYFAAFFQIECKLGMGANGSVFLCQHVLDGTSLGHFAVKKVAVGESKNHLIKILKEVRLLERLHHRNIVTYHHAWLETCTFGSFGPPVPTLHVLMQWADGGSLDDFIDVRLGRETSHIHVNPLSATLFSDETPTTPIAEESNTPDLHSRSARIRAFRAYQNAPQEERERMRRRMETSKSKSWMAVHLLSAEEINSLFKDIVEGLAFLHGKAILHLDLKPGNVLLTWDDGNSLIPRALLSDFGTSRDMIASSIRSGNTGTLEYIAPESLPSPRTGLLAAVDSKADMWSLGMILHKLLFLKLPYRYAEAAGESVTEGTKMERLEQEVLNFPGFKVTSALVTTFESRRLPRAFLVLLESLLNPNPSGRPSCERVLTAIREGRLDPLNQTSTAQAASSALLPLIRRLSSDIHREQANSTEDPPQTPVQNDLEPTLPEKLPLLGLPEPEPETISRPLLVSFDSAIPLRTIKACILIAKVSSLQLICSDGIAGTFVVSLVLVLAVIDTWFDDLRSTTLLASIHVLLVFTCPSNICCR